MSRYTRILEWIFLSKYTEETTEIDFERTDMETAADSLDMYRPKNLGDVVYSFRYRKTKPAAITERTPPGHEWIIRGIGKGRYRFALVDILPLEPTQSLVTDGSS